MMLFLKCQTLVLIHPLIKTDPETRVRHARGQSLPDWLEMHSGNVDTFPDGVAFPESSEQIRELLAHAKKNNLIVIPYGGGTSVVGHINPETSDKSILTIDMAKMNSMLSIDTESQLATFGAGAPGPVVEKELKNMATHLATFPSLGSYLPWADGSLVDLAVNNLCIMGA